MQPVQRPDDAPEGTPQQWIGDHARAGFIPRDTRQRADMFARTAGTTADHFPIPLTPIQQ